MKNLMEKLDNNFGKINPRYDATLENLNIIRANSKDLYELICYGFSYGYLQGQKAAFAEMKKKAGAK